MSVLIKGMEMPKSCFDCTMESVCNRWALHDAEWQKTNRDEDCPLVPVPEHGRLIDADTLTKMCQEMQSIEWNNKASPYSWAYAYESFESDIDNAPTIIPASEEGGNG